MLTRDMAKELGPRGILANALAPGAIETDFGDGAVRDNPQPNARAVAYGVGRVRLPHDIGEAPAALLSDRTNWIKGQGIEASGGMLV